MLLTSIKKCVYLLTLLTAFKASSRIGLAQTISAFPNPMYVTDGSGLGITNVSWSAPCPPGQTIGVYVGPGLNKLFCDSGVNGNSGSCTTGKWVTDGMTFVLANENTGQQLAEITVSVRNEHPPGCTIVAGPVPPVIFSTDYYDGYSGLPFFTDYGSSAVGAQALDANCIFFQISYAVLGYPGMIGASLAVFDPGTVMWSAFDNGTLFGYGLPIRCYSCFYPVVESAGFDFFRRQRGYGRRLHH